MMWKSEPPPSKSFNCRLSIYEGMKICMMSLNGSGQVSLDGLMLVIFVDTVTRSACTLFLYRYVHVCPLQ